MSEAVGIGVGIVLGRAPAFLAIRLLRPFGPSAGWGLLPAHLPAPVLQRLRRRMRRPVGAIGLVDGPILWYWLQETERLITGREGPPAAPVGRNTLMPDQR